MVKFLKEHMEKAGCKLADNFVKAVNCDQQMSGGYLRGEGVRIFLLTCHYVTNSSLRISPIKAAIWTW